MHAQSRVSFRCGRQAGVEDPPRSKLRQKGSGCIYLTTLDPKRFHETGGLDPGPNSNTPVKARSSFLIFALRMLLSRPYTPFAAGSDRGRELVVCGAPKPTPDLKLPAPAPRRRSARHSGTAKTAHDDARTSAARRGGEEGRGAGQGFRDSCQRRLQ